VIGVVPAAGRGTRLEPLTDDRPKGLVEVGGQPLLAHVFETLLASGVSGLVVVVGYRAGRIIERFGDAFGGLAITYVHQRERQGLGHAVLQAAPHVDGPFVVLNGDNMLAGDLRGAIERMGEAGVDAILAVEQVDQETAQETGVVSVADEADGGQVIDVVEKPTEPPSTLATTGCYVLPAEVFAALELCRPSDRGEYELPDGIGVLVRAGARVEAVELGCERVNVNTPGDVERAEKLLDGR
jgi:glucose-1-phosphate thymidylyltransferase